jgi:hypothetical protein
MVLEDSDPGLRAAAQSARAQRRTAPPIAPPMPPDEMASPFARPSGPRIHSVSRDVAPFEPPAPKPPKVAKDPLASKKDVQREKASKLIDSLLVKWYNEAKKNIPQADKNLALQLMLNGSALIECGFPLDTLRNLIELKQRLLVTSLEDDSGSEDAMTVHKWMSREDIPKGEEEEPEEE